MPPATAKELTRAFAADWTAGQGAPVADAVVAQLAAACDRARAAYPELVAVIDDAELVGALARGAPAPGDGVAGYVAASHADELALALAAGRAEPAAIATLERVHHAAIDAVCRRFVRAALPIDDLRQILRERLLLAPPGKRAKITEYAGRGALGSFIRIAACRVFLDHVKRKDRARELTPLDDQPLELIDPDDLALETIKAEYRTRVVAAMREAARELAPEDRQVLRLALAGGLSIDQIGVALGIHRATAARRVGRARDALASLTRKRVAAALELAPHELGAIVGLVASRIDLSLGSLLATTTGKPPPR